MARTTTQEAAGPGATPTGLETMLCFDLYAASRAMTAAYRPVLAAAGLTYPQYLVLVALWTGDDVPIHRLAAVLRLDHATLTPLLRRLEQRGLLTRTRAPEDARSVRVALTPAGDALRSILDDVHCAVTAATGLTTQELADAQEVLRRLTASLGTSALAAGDG